ncbi:50S ribosomal protein L24 [Candidatus Parcubacteria bacterium]|nr:MAG: 50S ribosomal protein L24 [Candidatus Parcubacteria bacterium]
MKIKKGDIVKILKGKDKGKTGKVEKIFPADNKVLVEGINQYKRHVKGKTANQKSEIVTITKPLPVASIALFCQKCKKPTRVGYRLLKDKKTRICRKCEEEV